MTDAEIKDEVCRRLIEGDSLRAVCRTENMPSKMTICRWLAADEEFRRQYAIARDMQAEALADEILDIADNPMPGVKTTTKGDGSVEKVTGDMIDHRRLQVDARKWIASKLAPKKYGEAALIKLGDSDGNRLEEMDESTRATRLAAIVASLSSRASEKLD